MCIAYLFLALVAYLAFEAPLKRGARWILAAYVYGPRAVACALLEGRPVSVFGAPVKSDEMANTASDDDYRGH